MKIRLQFIWIILGVLITQLSYSQGNSCANPFVISSMPFNQGGFNACGKGNTYTNSNTCITDQWAANGEDFVFRYNATANISCMNIFLSHSGTKYGWGIALYDGCPTSGGVCVDKASVVGGNVVGIQQTISDTIIAINGASLTAGKTYYIVVTSGLKSGFFGGSSSDCLNGFRLKTTICPPPLPTTPQGFECSNNLGFEAGNMNNWTATYQDKSSGATCCPITATNTGFRPGVNSVNGSQGTCFASSGYSGAQHTVTSGTGFDVNSNNQIPVVAPGGGNYSVRLGNHEAGYNAECLEQSFVVQPGSELFTYLYAVVLQDPGDHTTTERPAMEIRITDPAGNPIPCGGQYSINSSNAISDGFAKATGTAPGCVAPDIFYKKWTAVGADLSAFIGQTLKIKFCTTDCSAGGHFGYGYIDTYCRKKEIQGSVLCNTGTPQTLTAPAGYQNYNWYAGPAPSGTVLSPTQTLTVASPNNGDIYTVRYESITNPGCFFQVTDTISVITLTTSPDTTLCAGAGNLNLRALANDGDATYQWTGPNGFTSTLKNPVITSPTTAATGTYTVRVTTPAGCTLTKNVVVTVKAATNLTVTPAITKCQNGIAETLTVTGSAGPYTWTSTPAGTYPATASISPNPTVTTTYTVSVPATAGACPAVGNTTITIKPKPTLSVANTTVCSGKAAILTATAPANSTYSWSTGANTVSVNVTPTTTTTYTVKATLNGCDSTTTATVNVNPVATPNFTTNTVCTGDPTLFTDGSTNVPAGSTYSWNFGDGTPAGSGNSPSHTYAAAGTYNAKLKITSPAGCADSITKVVTVNGTATVTVTTASKCNDRQAINVSVTGTGAGATINWSSVPATTPALPTNSSTTTISVSPAVTTTYSVSGTTATGCPFSGSGTITVKPLPPTTVTSPTICNKQTATVTASGATTYSWSTGATTAATSVTPSATTTYTVKGTTDGCDSSVVATVTVNQLPVPAFTSTTECQGTATAFTDASTVPAGAGNITGWNWAFGNGTNAATQNPTTTYASAGTYNAKLTVTTDLGCSDTLTKAVVVKPNPVPSFTATKACNKTATQFTNTSTVQGNGAMTYSWTFGDGTGTSTAPNPAYTYPSANSYTVDLVATANGCSTSVSTPVVVTPIPVANFTASNACVDAPISFTNTSSIASGTINTYTWDFGDGSPSSTVQSPSHTYTTAGTFNVKLSVVSDNSCSKDTTIQLTVYPKATVNFTSTQVCLNNATQFTNQSVVSSGTISSYNWTFGDGNTSTATDPTNTYLAQGSYSVTLTATTDQGCISSATKTAVVNPLPVADFIYTQVCKGNSTQLTDKSTITSGAVTGWMWDFGDTTAMSAQQNPGHVYQYHGTHNVTLIATSDLGCRDTVTKPIIVNPIPVVDFTVDDADGCPVHCVNLADQSSIALGSIANYEWTFGDSSAVVSGASNLAAHCYNNTGRYTLTLKVTSDKGCTATKVKTDTIFVFPVPSAEFASEVVGNEGQSAATIINPVFGFTNQSVDYVNCNWNFGDGDSTNICGNPTHMYKDTGTYVVVLTIENQYGCKDTILHPVRVDPDFTFYVPNAFTPNGDGINDGFFGTGIGILEYEMWIFDRWGNKVWYSNKLDDQWDGKVQGGPSGDVAQQDVYVWLVKLKHVATQQEGGVSSKPKSKSYTGTVTLIR